MYVFIGIIYVRNYSYNNSHDWKYHMFTSKNEKKLKNDEYFIAKKYSNSYSQSVTGDNLTVTFQKFF